jgi:AraC family transcriptional regulator
MIDARDVQRANLSGVRVPRAGEHARALEAAMDYVRENLAGDLSPADLARRANLSVSHFSRLFKQNTGLSPQRYVMRERVERAKALLASTDMTMQEVAIAAGFANPGHLDSCFKRWVGSNPGRFRSSLRAAQNASDVLRGSGAA